MRNYDISDMEEFNINLFGIYQVKWQNNSNQQSELIISTPTLVICDDGWVKEEMRASKQLKSNSGSNNVTAEKTQQPPYYDTKLWTQLE